MESEVLAAALDRMAEHERNIASAFRAVGRPLLAREQEVRAHAFEEAALLCRGTYGDPARVCQE